MDDHEAPATKNDLDWIQRHLQDVQESLGYWTTGLWLCSQVQIILVGLKVARAVEWSWWMVAVPTWGPITVFIAVAALVRLSSLWPQR